MVKKALLGFYIVCTLFFVVNFANQLSTKDGATVQYINIGQGDASLITTQSGRHMLIDSGNDDATATSDASIVNFLRNDGVTHIDVATISHYDSDHSGGMRYVAYYFSPDLMILPKPMDADEQSKCNDIISECGSNTKIVYAKQGDDLKIGDNFEADVIWNDPTAAASNDRCIVMQAIAYDNRFLYTGDITTLTEDEMIADLPNDELKSNVVKVAHHGSRFSSSTEFYNVTKPVYAVISVGKNSYGHPTQEAMDRIASSGATILRTDQSGTITFHVDWNGLRRVSPASIPESTYESVAEGAEALPTATPIANDYIYVSVAFANSQKTYYYLADNDNFEIGQKVMVPTSSAPNGVAATVVAVEHYAKENVPYPLDQMKWIMGTAN